MKIKTKCLSLAAALALLLTGCSAERISDEVLRRIVEAERKSTSRNVQETQVLLPDVPLPPEATEVQELPHGGVLSADDVFLIFSHELRNFNNTILVEGMVDGDKLDEAYYRVIRERPDLFWVAGYSSRYTDNKADVDFAVVNDLTADQLRKMYAELKDAVDRVAAEAQRYPTDYDKILYVHDYIVSNTEYDEAAANSGRMELGSTAYGCLVQGSAVCQGYAEAFQLVMQRLEITCGICSGTGKNGSHAWNYVIADGNYYWLDATWDDPVSDTVSGSYLSHAYCLINDEMLMRTRVFDSDCGYIPKCTSLNDNYFVRSGSYLTQYQFSEIDSRMSAAASQSQDCIEVMFADGRQYQMALDDLFGAERIWDASVFYGRGGSCAYTCDDDMYVLRIEFTVN